jgi:hypothetical protein
MIAKEAILSVSAETGCSHEPICGTSWDEHWLPTAPAEAIAEWLRREPCDQCGCHGAGCILVYDVWLTLYSDDQDDFGTVIDECHL